jgi:hypothetical protein
VSKGVDLLKGDAAATRAYGQIWTEVVAGKDVVIEMQGKTVGTLTITATLTGQAKGGKGYTDEFMFEDSVNVTVLKQGKYTVIPSVATIQKGTSQVFKAVRLNGRAVEDVLSTWEIRQGAKKAALPDGKLVTIDKPVKLDGKVVVDILGEYTVVGKDKAAPRRTASAKLRVVEVVLVYPTGTVKCIVNPRTKPVEDKDFPANIGGGPVVQLAGGKIEIAVEVKGISGPVEVRFTSIDADDASPYERGTDGKEDKNEGDNRDPGNGRGGFKQSGTGGGAFRITKVLSQDPRRNAFDVLVKSRIVDGKNIAKVILETTKTHAGDNYVVGVGLPDAGKAPLVKTKAIVGWRRVYYVFLKMYEKGAPLAHNVGPGTQRITTVKNHNLQANDKALVFDRDNPRGYEVEVVRRVNNKTVEIKPVAVGKPTIRAGMGLDMGSPHHSKPGGGIVKIGVPAYSFSLRFFQNAYGSDSDTVGADGHAFITFKRIGSVLNIPSMSTDSRKAGLSRIAESWALDVFQDRDAAKGTLPNTFALIAARQDSRRPTASGGTDQGTKWRTYSAVYVHAIRNLPIYNKRQKAIIVDEIPVHEVGHQSFPNREDTQAEHHRRLSWDSTTRKKRPCIMDNGAYLPRNKRFDFFIDSHAEFEEKDLRFLREKDHVDYNVRATR